MKELTGYVVVVEDVNKYNKLFNDSKAVNRFIFISDDGSMYVDDLKDAKIWLDLDELTNSDILDVGSLGEVILAIVYDEDFNLINSITLTDEHAVESTEVNNMKNEPNGFEAFVKCNDCDLYGNNFECASARKVQGLIKSRLIDGCGVFTDKERPPLDD